MDGWVDANKHGAQAASAVPWCGCLQGSPCSSRDDPGAHGNEWMGQMQKQGLAGMGSRQRQADKAWQGKTRQDKAVVANGPVVKLTGTGLVVKTVGR